MSELTPIEDPDLDVQGQTLSLVVTAAQSVRALIGLRLQALGLVPGQDRLLLALCKDGPDGLSAIAAKLNIRASTVSKMIDRLTEREHVRRVADPDDLRRINVELTDRGRDVCDEVRAIHQATEAELRLKIDADDINRIVDSLEVLNEVLLQQLRRRR